jgi:hypothetical protein
MEFASGVAPTRGNRQGQLVPSSFTPAAWLDTTDLIGTIQNSQTVAIVHLSQGTSLENWGFSGQIVGDVMP